MVTPITNTQIHFWCLRIVPIILKSQTYSPRNLAGSSARL
jgi:hypothetical protein